ncbi:zinc finger MYM-type protein 1-like protein [Tanacetum coccineum]
MTIRALFLRTHLEAAVWAAGNVLRSVPSDVSHLYSLSLDSVYRDVPEPLQKLAFLSQYSRKAASDAGPLRSCGIGSFPILTVFRMTDVGWLGADYSGLLMDGSGKPLALSWGRTPRLESGVRAKIGVYLKRKVSPSKRNVSNDIPQESPPKSTTGTPSSVVPIRIDLDSLPLDNVEKQGGNDAFVINGFDSWHKKAYLYAHVGNVDSYHNRAFQKCENLLKENQSIADAFNKKSEIEKARYIIRLNATISCVRLCLKTENPMRGHDESETSLFKGMFLEVYHFLKDHNEAIRAVTLEIATKNCTLTSPQIQKDVVDCFAKEIVKSICLEIGADASSLLVDECSDVSKKEQMAIVLRYVDKYRLVKERFVGIVQVKDTSSLTLKAGIDSLFSKHGLSLKQLRGQSYDGSSNMCGEFNGLKALILKENESAYYVHCFAHQLQLVVVAVAKNHDGVESYKERLEKEIARGEIKIGKGKNQEVTLIRAGDTRWGSHHRTITSLIKLFPEVLNVLHYVKEDGNTLKDQNILEAVSLVKGTIRALKQTRASGFPSLLKNVTLFCELHGIEMVDMAESHSKSRRNKITNQHHFEVDIFNTVLDMQIQEFGDRFSESSTELLENMATLSPHNSFTDFNISKLVKLSEMYPHDFTYMERLRLPTDLAVYYQIMSNDKDFFELSSISKLASLMVEKNKHTSHPLIYRLLKLALILPVATATVERCFSKMKLVKTDLRNRMGEEYFNGALICAIEKEELMNVTNEVVRKQFFGMKDRRGSK